MTVVDAHQHVWDLEKVSYPWLVPEYGPLYRTYAQDEIDAVLDRCGVDASILVQAADSVEETRWMQATADRSERVRGIVGWVPLDRPGEAAELLDDYAADPRIVGVRHLVHEDPDPDWLLRPEVGEGLALLAERGYTFDVVAVLPRHLEHVPTLSERHPDLAMVVDHLAKPPIASGGWQPWAGLLAAAAQNPRVHAKVSGLNTAADTERWTADDLRRYVDHALEVFGPDRLMYGGDWPVTVLAGGYEKVWDATLRLLEPLSQAERDEVLGGTATRFYGLGEPRRGTRA
jgi:L-fuconolactonase